MKKKTVETDRICEACGGKASLHPIAPSAWNKGVGRVCRDATTWEVVHLEWCIGCDLAAG